jgi:hypothetical protein
MKADLKEVRRERCAASALPDSRVLFSLSSIAAASDPGASKELRVPQVGID